MRLIKLFTLCFLLISLTACVEDLNPESKDLRSKIDLAPSISNNFIATTTVNESINLEDELLNYDAVVLYFTMWCPTCDSHMSHIQQHVMDNYTNVRFLMVDYVSANTSQSRSLQVSNGYGAFTVLSDSNQSLLNQYEATMASVVVIDDQNRILLNEDYKTGTRLINTLNNLGNEP